VRQQAHLRLFDRGFLRSSSCPVGRARINDTIGITTISKAWTCRGDINGQDQASSWVRSASAAVILPVMSVKVFEARRNARGIHVTAHYRAPKIPAGYAVYAVQLVLDPSNGGIIGASFWLHNRSAGSETDQYTTKRAEMAREIRDEFLKLPAWRVLIDNPPEWPTAVTAEGKIIVR